MLWAVSEGSELSGDPAHQMDMRLRGDIANAKRDTEEQKSLGSEFLAWMEERPWPVWCHITDFGLGKFSNAANNPSLHTVASIGGLGTPGYMAPETLGDNPVFSVQSDIYSLGVLLYCICSCRTPPSIGVPGRNAHTIPIRFPKRLRDIVERCTRTDPAERPNSLEAANEISEAYLDLLEDQKFGQIKRLLTRAVTAVGTYSVQRDINPPVPRDTNPPIPRDIDPFTPNESSDRAEPLPQIFQQIQLNQSSQITDKVKMSRKELNKAIRQALQDQDAERMESLIQRRADVNIEAFDKVRDKISWLKSHNREANILEMSERSGAIPNSYVGIRLNLVHFAALTNAWDCLLVLLEAGARHNNKLPYRGSPLVLAIAAEEVNVIQVLVKKHGFQLIDLSGWFTPALEYAMCWGKAASVRTLLELGGNIRILRSNRRTLLHILVISLDMEIHNAGEIECYLACVKLALEAAPDLLSTTDSNGFTPLLYTVHKSLHHNQQEYFAPLIKLLITSGANPFSKGGRGDDAFQTKLEKHDVKNLKDKALVPAQDYPVIYRALMTGFQNNG
ncbi:hypothetical protein AA313_de0205732 [Arthrobotrys entomopaga]|nr:hypothetical protein AA313_de0205732 [Arthrobotrys entomopaga]